MNMQLHPTLFRIAKSLRLRLPSLREIRLSVSALVNGIETDETNFSLHACIYNLHESV